jgi:hypothetical protein
MKKISIADLSHTISELIDLDADSESLVASAIDRALSAKEIKGGTSVAINPTIAGGITPAPTPKTTPPLINGLIINPNPTTSPCSPDYFPIGRIVKPTNCNPPSFPIGKIARNNGKKR